MRYVSACVRGLGVVTAVGCCSAAFGQPYIGPSLGTVELRWRERSTAGYNGSYTIGPWVTPGVDAMPTPDVSAASVTAQDASVVLVLEARVTQAAGISGNPIRGLMGANFDMLTNQTSGGAFARQIVVDGSLELNPRGNARVSATNLGFDPTTLPGHPGPSTRGTVAPFRGWTDFAGPGTTGAGVGVVQPNLNRLYSQVYMLQTGLLDPANIDASHPGEYDKAGLDAWVPLYVASYTITDVSTPRDIVFSVSTRLGSAPEDTDYGFRTWRGATNLNNADIDLWLLSPGFTTPPTFTVHVVPGPGAAGAIGVAGLMVIGRRRR